jgi:hypothetical protein
VLVSPTLIDAAGGGLILGDEVKVHAKGMREALGCRELLGHEDHPGLLLQEEAASFTTLAEPIPFSYMSLTDKHLDEKMHPGTLLSLSARRAIVEVTYPLESYANIMLRLEAGAGDEESELYAKGLSYNNSIKIRNSVLMLAHENRINKKAIFIHCPNP